MGKRLNTYLFILRAQEVHGDRYRYDEVVYMDMWANINIICKRHGTFVQTPASHIHQKAGCLLCYQERRGNTTRYTKDKFIEQANLIHNNLYSYENVEYLSNKKKVSITCSIHGDFLMRPNDHITSKQKCPTCSGHIQTTAEFIKRSIEKHGNLYLYDSTVYNKYEEPVVLKCERHGEFSVTPRLHLVSEVGCPVCSGAGYSRKAIKWLDTFVNDIQHAGNGGEFVIPSTLWKVDGYCKETKTVYEFYGDCFHGNPNKYKGHELCHPFIKDITAYELYQKTMNREQKIKEMGFNVVSVWELEWDATVKLESKHE